MFLSQASIFGICFCLFYLLIHLIILENYSNVAFYRIFSGRMNIHSVSKVIANFFVLLVWHDHYIMHISQHSQFVNSQIINVLPLPW